MQKPLSQYSIEELRSSIGQRVYSIKTLVQGTLISVSEQPDREDYTVNIDFDNGNQAHLVWHFWLDNIYFVISK